MTKYTPDKFVVLEIKNGEEKYYKVLGGWFGGYLGADSWRLNSGITRAEYVDGSWYFYGSSGSVYKCHVDSYGFTSLMLGVYSGMGEGVRVLDDQEWAAVNWDWNLK